MRLRIVVVLLLVAACTSNGSTPKRASSPPAGSPTAIATAAAAPATPSPTPALTPVVLAVTDNDPGLALYSVQPGGHAAVLLRRLTTEVTYDVSAVSVSAGPRPTVCAILEPPTEGAKQLWCYAPGASRGRLVTKNVSNAVGVRPDGRALAWTDTSENQGLVLADLNGDVATVRSRSSYAAKEPPHEGVPESLDALEWLGPATLVGTAGGDSDESRGLCVIDVNHPRDHTDWGFGRCLHPTGKEADLGYAHFEHAALVRQGVVATTERIMGCCTDAPTGPAARAVELRLADGAVLGVVATPRAGRDVVGISGGPRAIVYATAGQDGIDPVFSIRWAGQVHGTPISGLPKNVVGVGAQP